MLRNFLTVAVRGFMRNEIYSAINTSGLALAILSASLIFLYVYDEFGFDTIHPDSAGLYSIGVSVTDKNGDKEVYGFSL
jgi:putative ABC transport system permease protein